MSGMCKYTSNIFLKNSFKIVVKGESEQVVLVC